MGHPKFPKKQFETPKHPWKEERVKSERELMKKYGLKNHREIWKAKTHLGRYREQARELLAKIETKNPQIKKESNQLLLHLTRMGILKQGGNLDDVLALEIESVLSRRLQTLVYLKGLASTVTHSRQLINHGHIAVDNKKVTIPGYVMTKEKEAHIIYTGRSPLNELSHPARPKSDSVTSKVSHIAKEKEPSEASKTEKSEKEPKTEQKSSEKQQKPSAEHPSTKEKTSPEKRQKEQTEQKETTSEEKEQPSKEQKEDSTKNEGEK